ncbi:MAG TPA: KGG domain-containing protein [Clostridia bacterium]
MKKRGFGSMNKEKQKKIASMGGVAAHKAGTAHKFSSTEGKHAGILGARKRWKKTTDPKAL